MAHFAAIPSPFPSHVKAFEALCSELLARGHAVSWVQQADVAGLLQERRIGFHAVGAASHPPGTLARIVARAARPGGFFGLRRVILDVAEATDMLCTEAAPVLRSLAPDMVLADQMEAAGGLLARALRLPFVSVACALPVDREAGVPLPVMPFGYADSEQARQRNEGSARVYDWLMAPHARVIERHARAFGLGRLATLADCVSPLLEVSQTTAAFDFPRASPPPQLQHVGPLRPTEASDGALPWPIGPERPFVFCSFGTLQGGRLGLFRRVARACRAAGAQLLVAHCGGLDAAQQAALRADGADWVTDFAPQQAAIARADVVITHGGLNTVMDSLAAGKPMLVLPIAFDQPGVAARVVHGGAGLRLLPPLASSHRLKLALQRLLAEPEFGLAAARLGESIARSGGTRRAADLIERCLAEQEEPQQAQQQQRQTVPLSALQAARAGAATEAVHAV
ncbi:MAG: glycosyltransferase [Comamonadaceae bacterium]|nr:MAG: glycosyltransferase [Comamonadaceae bacterium]